MRVWAGVAVAVVAMTSLVGVAAAEQPTPESGTWKSKAGQSPDRVRFAVREVKDGYRISAVRLTAAVNCERRGGAPESDDSEEAVGPAAAARRISLTLPGPKLKRTLPNGRIYKMLRFTTSRKRILTGDRRQSVVANVRFLGDRSARVRLRIRDVEPGADGLVCRGTVGLRARPAKG